MTALEVTLIIVGILFVVVSFFIEEKLSQKDIDKIVSLSEEELRIIVERQLSTARSRIDDSIEEAIDDSTALTKRAMEKETNEKIMAINEYSNTVFESMNKSHNEILFLYNMLNDKHTELTDLAGKLQDFSATIRNTQNEVLQNIEDAARELETKMKEPPPTEAEEAEDEMAGGMFKVSKDMNRNERILVLHREGLTNVQIAKELGFGLGEVNLVIGLYKGAQEDAV